MSDPPLTCAICQVAAAATTEDIVYRGRHFTAATGMDVPGWVLLWTDRHAAQGLWELSDEESEELGTLLRDLARALRQECGAERTYVMAMGEHALHFHAMVMARPTDAATETRGAALLASAPSLADKVAARMVAAKLRPAMTIAGRVAADGRSGVSR